MERKLFVLFFVVAKNVCFVHSYLLALSDTVCQLATMVSNNFHPPFYSFHLTGALCHQRRYKSTSPLWKYSFVGVNIDWATSKRLDFKHIRLDRILAPEREPRIVKVVQVSSHQGEMVFPLIVGLG